MMVDIKQAQPWLCFLSLKYRLMHSETSDIS